MIKRPMLAAKTPEDLTVLRYPLLGSYKLDGIRALVIGGVVYSRTLKPIPSRYVQETFGRQEFNGLDGELIFGDPASPTCYSDTYSAVMTQASNEPVQFWVFDYFGVTPVAAVAGASNIAYRDRWSVIDRISCGHPEIVVLHQRTLERAFDVLAHEEQALNEGYEGLIIRDPMAGYKEGRSTLREQALVKVKRTQDAEAVIIGFQELLRNRNEAVLDALGYTKRSSHLDNMVPAGTLGALICKTIPDGVEFRIGSGFDMQLRDEIWQNQALWLDRVVTFKHLPYGAKDAPRHPIYKGLRGSGGKVDS